MSQTATSESSQAQANDRKDPPRPTERWTQPLPPKVADDVWRSKHDRNG